jgi:SAM-dependent methyltransferase
MVKELSIDFRSVSHKLYFSDNQKIKIFEVKEKIKKKIYKFTNNPCLCGNNNKKKDFVIANEDRYTIPVTTVLCQNCGLIRLKEIFDHKSNSSFYKNEYRAIYNPNIFSGKEASLNTFFDSQKQHGIEFLDLIKKLNLGDHIKNVLDIGCGSGGALLPFRELGCKVKGYDFDEQYVNFGKEKGLEIHLGEKKIFQLSNSYDLIILSHVLEHLNDPIESLNQFMKLLGPEKFLLIEVPGIFWEAPGYNSYPILSIQNAHVYQFFYRFFLDFLFKKINLIPIYGDERCTFVLQKPLNWKPSHATGIYSKEMSFWSKKINNLITKKSIEYQQYANE